MPVASFREVIMYLRPDEEAKVKLGPNEEVVDQHMGVVNGEHRWSFIIRRLTAK